MKFPLVCLMILASLLPVAAPAQTDGEPLPLYDIEIVIFKNLKVPQSREYALPVSSPGRGEIIVDLASEDSVAAAREFGFEILPPDELRLLDIVARLVDSPRYELLMHVAWRQPGLDREQAIPVWLKGGRIYGNEYTSIDDQIELMSSIPFVADPDEQTSFQFDAQTPEALEQQLEQQRSALTHSGLYELEGRITVALSRYLHVFTDLVLRRPRLVIEEGQTNAAQDEYLAARAADTRILNNHRLKEHRRMRSKNLHYLDNPEFSMLILINPYEPPENGAIDND